MWLSLPLLFVAAVLGLTEVGLWMFGGSSPTLSGPVLGAAAAMAYFTGSGMGWSSGWRRQLLRHAYSVALLAAGLTLDGVPLPAGLCVSLGLPAGIILVRLVRRESLCGQERAATRADQDYTRLSGPVGL